MSFTAAFRSTDLPSTGVSDEPNVFRAETVRRRRRSRAGGCSSDRRRNGPGRARVEIGYVLEGSVTLEHEGQPAKVLKAGDSFKNEPGVHNAKNTGTSPVKILAIYLVEKGKPLAEPAP